MSKLRIMGCDPGFANIGLAVVDLFPSGEAELLATRLVLTAPSKDKKVKQIQDEIRRLHEIEGAFLEFADQWSPDVLAAEEPGKCLMKRVVNGRQMWQTNPTLLRTSCLMWGAMSGICRVKQIMLMKFGSQEIKKAVCKNNKATKTQMTKAIKRRFPYYEGWAKTQKVEHEVDAVGATVAAFKAPFVVSLMQDLAARK